MPKKKQKKRQKKGKKRHPPIWSNLNDLTKNGENKIIRTPKYKKRVNTPSLITKIIEYNLNKKKSSLMIKKKAISKTPKTNTTSYTKKIIDSTLNDNKYWWRKAKSFQLPRQKEFLLKGNAIRNRNAKIEVRLNEQNPYVASSTWSTAGIR